MSQAQSLSSTLPRRLWAKGRRHPAKEGESLAFHTASVAAMLVQLAKRTPALTEIAGTPRLWHRAFWACWLHDLGKAARPFQAYVRDQRGPWGQRHEVLSLAFLPLAMPPDSEDFPWVASAIASHHREAPKILVELYDPHLPIESLLDEMVGELEDDAIVGVARWLGETAPAWLSGTVLDRLGVGTSATPFAAINLKQFRRDAPESMLRGLRAYEALWRSHQSASTNPADRRQAVLLRGLVLLADHLASGHAGRLPDLDIPDAPALLRRAGAPTDEPRSHQAKAGQSAGSIVLAAPTGSGKTEAALLWARRQLEEPGVATKLIYLLPYQASLNAMRTRLQSVLSTEVALLHGRSSQVLYRELTERGYTGRQAEQKARRSVDLAGLHHPPVWVATPYQLLRAAYRLPGYEKIWASLGQNLIVIDEPHAYEPERLGLMLGLFGELVRNWGVRVCAMSATLPSWLRRLLEETLDAQSLPIDRALFAAFQRHQLRLVPGEIVDDTIVENIVREVVAGRSVLVGVNTVARAQAMRFKLDQRLGSGQLRLLHGRFSGRDRLAREQEILAVLRAGTSHTPATGLAVVATQVIEVSLDLDFDTIFTEPAPLEALAQRFGRVNRRGKKGLVPVHVLTAPKDGQHVYDHRLVERTLDQLARVDGQALDEALLGDCLDRIYHDDLAEEYVRKVDDSRRAFEQICIRPLHAFESDESLEHDFDRLFEGTEVLPASLVAEYRQLAEESVLQAQTLLVPLRDSQRYRLGSAAQWAPDLKLWVVDVPYTCDLGLQLPDSTAPEDR